MALQRRIDEAKDIHEDFRLWFTWEHTSLPQLQLLQRSIVIHCQPIRAIRYHTNTFVYSINESVFEESSAKRSVMSCLVHLHRRWEWSTDYAWVYYLLLCLFRFSCKVFFWLTLRSFQALLLARSLSSSFYQYIERYEPLRSLIFATIHRWRWSNRRANPRSTHKVSGIYLLSFHNSECKYYFLSKVCVYCLIILRN